MKIYSDINKLLLIAIAVLFSGISLMSCSNDSKDQPDVSDETETPSVAPDFNSTIEPFNSSIRATDSYTAGTDNDIYWQANKFASEIEVVYDGSSATVTPSTVSGVNINVSGAHVAIDISSDTKTKITLTGTTSDGSLKIYSPAKTLVVFDNANITSTKGPALNCQSKKRLFVEIPEGSSSSITDAAVYSDDPYYQSGSSADLEDRKGAFFAEGNVIISGKGLLQVNGHNRHALATDGMLRILPGTTLAVTSDVKDGLHAKGSSKEQTGILVEGGYIYALCTGDAGKCMNSDLDIVINSGTLSLNTSAEAIFDTEDNSTSSGAGMKSDTNVNINGGDITIKTTGNGAKGVSAESDINVTDADITITATGKQYSNSIDSSSPAGLKADGNISINSGTVNVAMYGEDSSSDAIKGSGKVSVSGGEVYCYAYGKGLYSAGNLSISGGEVYSLSQRNEAITSKTAISVTGGVVLSHSPKAISASVESILTVSNATIIAAGGYTMTTVDSKSTCCKVFDSVNIPAYVPFAVSSSTGTALYAMRFLPACEGMPLLLASPSFKSGTSWILSTGGTLSTESGLWNGYGSGVSVNEPTSTEAFQM